MNTRLPARPHSAMRLNDVIASSNSTGRPTCTTIATRTQLVERPACGRDEQEREHGVDDRGETAHGHPGAECQGEGEMLAVALSD